VRKDVVQETDGKYMLLNASSHESGQRVDAHFNKPRRFFPFPLLIKDEAKQLRTKKCKNTFFFRSFQVTLQGRDKKLPLLAFR